MHCTARALFAFCVLTTGASAQVGSGLPDCDRTYRDMWLGMMPVAAKALTGPQLADLQRYTLRAYDGCTSGDERAFDQDFFTRLGKVPQNGADQWMRDLITALPKK
jgi:hypothetical protein